MRILQVPIFKLKSAEYNPRQMTKKQANDLIESIRRFGFVDPLIVNKHKNRENVVIGGHQRLKVAEILGMKTVPVIYVDLNEIKERELNLRLNRNTGEWNWDALAEFDKELLLDVGFDEKELNKYFQLDVVEDEAPELPKEAKSKLGDLYLLGNHRLLCGDATKKEDVERLMNGQKADMVFTDPPYGVGYDGGAKKRELLEADNLGTTIYSDALPNLRFAAADHAALYLWYADAHVAAAAAAAAGYEITAQIIWTKNNAQFVSTAHYHGKHEPCFYAHRKGKSNQWFGGKNEVTVWEVDRANRNEFHPTQKPVALAARAINNSSKQGDSVLDLFGGSGSTLIACEQLNRKCRMSEIDSRYVDVILKRWMKLTGKMAYRIGDANEKLHKEPVSCAELGITP